MAEKSWNFHTVNWIESESIKKCTLSGSNSEEKESPDQKEERNGNEEKVFENVFRLLKPWNWLWWKYCTT